MNTSPSTSKGTVKAPTLGKCPECKMLFQKAKFALQCCICKRNYHSQCLNINSQGDRTSEMIAGIKSVEKNLICTNCETAAQTAIAEQQMLQDQLGQMQSKLRSHEQDTERLRHEQQRQLDAMRQTCQGVLTEDHQKMVDDFNKLKEEHERAKQEMEEKEIAQAARFQMALTEATTEINQKAAVLGISVQQNKEMEATIAQLRSENRVLSDMRQQANTSMEVDIPRNNSQHREERQISFQCFNEIMAEHQRRLSETLIQLISP